jgi:hypothetical protein
MLVVAAAMKAIQIKGSGNGISLRPPAILPL